MNNSMENFRMKERTLVGFGERLTHLRKARGLTQTELGNKVGVSQRVIAYYEQDGAQPPGPMLIDLADALRISVDELLGRTPPKSTPLDAKTARLLKRLQRIQELPPPDRQAVLKVLDALLAQHGNSQLA